MRDVGLVIEDVVGALGLAAGDELAADDDAALGEADLLADLQHPVPARAFHGGALMRAELLSSTKLFVDETTAPVLDPGRGRAKRGYFWVLARDDRPWRGGAPPAVVYSYAPGRSGDHAAALLQG